MLLRRLLFASPALAAMSLVLLAACGAGECRRPTFHIPEEPEDIVAHCKQVVAAECARAFSDCPDHGVYTVEYPDLATCQAEAPGDVCIQTLFEGFQLDDAKAASCRAAIPEVTCAELSQEGGPKACWHVQVPVPPEPSACPVVTFGTHEGRLTTAVTKEWGRFVGIWCLCLDAGEPVKVTVAHGVLDSPVIHLLGPTGEVVEKTENDTPLRAEAAAGGPHMIVIGERDGATKGTAYELTIEPE